MENIPEKEGLQREIRERVELVRRRWQKTQRDVATALVLRADDAGVVVMTAGEIEAETTYASGAVYRALREILKTQCLKRLGAGTSTAYRWDFARLGGQVAASNAAPATVHSFADAVEKRRAQEDLNRGFSSNPGREYRSKNDEWRPVAVLTPAEQTTADIIYHVAQKLKGEAFKDPNYAQPWGRLGYGFDKPDAARTIIREVQRAARTKGTTEEKAAEHLVGIYIREERPEKGREGGTNAWRKGLPLDWMACHVDQLAKTFRDKPARPSSSSGPTSTPASSRASDAEQAAAAAKIASGIGRRS